MSPIFDFFGTVRLFSKKFLMSQKGPLRVFSYFATECMLINPEGSPLYIFRHYATFSERRNVKNFMFFFQTKCFALFEP